MFDVDTAVVLDLADRGPHDVVDLGRLDPSPLRLGAGQHQQRLAVAAHPGGEMVELVVVRQHARVVDLRLELVEHRQLAVDQRTVAASHRDEDVAHAASQHLDLFVGDVDERVLHRVERSRQLGQLVVAGGVDRVDLGQHGFAAGIAQGPHQCGQLLGGDLVGALRDGLDASRDRAADEQRDQRRQHHGGEADTDADQRRATGGVALGRRTLDDLLADRTLELDATIDELAERGTVEVGRLSALCRAGHSIEIAAELGELR